MKSTSIFLVVLACLLMFAGCVSITDNSLDVTDSIPENHLYEIKDSRENRESLVGKYVMVGRPEFFFEIYDDSAMLSAGLEEYGSFVGEVSSKIMEVQFINNVTWVGFVYQKTGAFHANALDFYSEGDGSFVWETYEFPDDHCVFKKQ